ncbi:4-hydroxyphenylacetate 3-hydroxylase N-terminal domain-containing protein [Bacillus sp. B15-48]|uniref:4-hydroxyphenylacetate 3-hydroxylase family protein n=1 Tax=Bacillus sp. B15-48 TaxID=1548601 RepID=UPI00193ED004|nr:4-hydroxyphenylacetate 3-hydroxylase N-terminal domain-containing protein [Bacillus sp. B15-48]MBM4764698.1 4-hydroxyphenylacetate 3-hydroxylase [Bacillus sp. B15-48]
MRTGKQYLESLKDGRCVYIGGEQVEDITTHPAFKGVSESVAKLYDMAADESQQMTYVTEDGNLANKVYMIPRSREDLTARREAIQKWSEATYGLLGRGPEHVASFMAGFAGNPDVFGLGGQKYAENAKKFYKYARDNSLYLTYALLPPQVDRSKAPAELNDGFTTAAVREEREDGIVVRGALMLATGAAIADYIFIGSAQPLQPGNEKYAFSAMVPVNAPGLKLYARQGYAMDKKSVFDYPLSTRFDESDSLVVLDDVFIPWEHVFNNQNIEISKNFFFATAAHALGNNQAQIRLVTKLKFILGLARKITAMNGIDKIPGVQEKLGELASVIASVEGYLLASEYQCEIDPKGVARPNARFLYGAMGMQNEMYPRVIQLFRELVGGGVLQPPSSYMELLNPETKNDIHRYLGTSAAEAEERAKIMKLAWDLIGSEFAGRHQHYEIFYAGPNHLVRGHSFRNYNFDETVELVDKCLNEYALPTKEVYMPQ